MNIDDKQNVASAEVLKNLMIDGKLPDEYITEANLDILLEYEYDQMGDTDEFYDMSIANYCIDLIKKNYTDENYEITKHQILENIKDKYKFSDRNAASKNKRRFNLLKISAACVVLLLSIQIAGVVAFEINLFNLSRKTFFSIMGVETKQDSISQGSSWSREYKTVEELETAENIKILVPAWFPGDVKVESVSYGYDFDKEQIILVYTDGTSLLVRLNSVISIEQYAQVYKNNDIIFNIYENSNIIEWEYGGNSYNLTCEFDMIEYAEKIIKNIK